MYVDMHTFTYTHMHPLPRFLQLDAEDLLPFVSVFKHIPLKRQTIITCITTLKKSHDEPDAVSCIVAGTENKDIYILDPEAFTVLKKVNFLRACRHVHFIIPNSSCIIKCCNLDPSLHLSLSLSLSLS